MTKNQIPAGSQGPAEETVASEETLETTPVEKTDGQPKGTEGTTPDKFAGKSPEDIATAYANLEKKFGEQGAKLGEISSLLAQLQEAKNPGAPQASYDDELNNIMAQLDEGTLDVPGAIIAAAKLGAKETEAIVAKKYQQFDEEKTTKQNIDRFMKDHPDFNALKASGELAAEMANDPLHDNFSAYFAIKARKAEAEAFERGKAEALKLAEGQNPSKKVVTQSGTQVHQQSKPKGPLSPAERRQAMLDAVKATRETT